MPEKRKKCILALIIIAAVIFVSGSYANTKKAEEQNPKKGKKGKIMNIFPFCRIYYKYTCRFWKGRMTKWQE